MNVETRRTKAERNGMVQRKTAPRDHEKTPAPFDRDDATKRGSEVERHEGLDQGQPGLKYRTHRVVPGDFPIV